MNALCCSVARRRAREADWTSLLMKGLCNADRGFESPRLRRESPANTSVVAGLISFPPLTSRPHALRIKAVGLRLSNMAYWMSIFVSGSALAAQRDLSACTLAKVFDFHRVYISGLAAPDPKTTGLRNRQQYLAKYWQRYMTNCQVRRPANYYRR